MPGFKLSVLKHHLVSALLGSFQPHCLLFFHGLSDLVRSVCSRAHTWALLRHSSKQQPSAAAVSPAPHRTFPGVYTWIIYSCRLSPVASTAQLGAADQTACELNPNRRTWDYGLRHRRQVFSLPMCLCTIIDSSLPAAPLSGGIFGHWKDFATKDYCV